MGFLAGVNRSSRSWSSAEAGDGRVMEVKERWQGWGGRSTVDGRGEGRFCDHWKQMGC